KVVNEISYQGSDVYLALPPPLEGKKKADINDILNSKNISNPNECINNLIQDAVLIEKGITHQRLEQQFKDGTDISHKNMRQRLLDVLEKEVSVNNEQNNIEIVENEAKKTNNQTSIKKEVKEEKRYPLLAANYKFKMELSKQPYLDDEERRIKEYFIMKARNDLCIEQSNNYVTASYIVKTAKRARVEYEIFSTYLKNNVAENMSKEEFAKIEVKAERIAAIASNEDQNISIEQAEDLIEQNDQKVAELIKTGKRRPTFEMQRMLCIERHGSHSFDNLPQNKDVVNKAIHQQKRLGDKEKTSINELDSIRYANGITYAKGMAEGQDIADRMTQAIEHTYKQALKHQEKTQGVKQQSKTIEKQIKLAQSLEAEKECELEIEM
ncbi:MAG: hypothetical protein HRT87_09280, partial [Legionellales bacterium]|nr:hypothetical protein [Legionellales bacterium]